MDLNKQFPDISMNIREQARLKRSRKVAAIKPVLIKTAAKTRSEIYGHEFRVWHLKLLFMMIILLAGVYVIILNAPWMFYLINSGWIYIESASIGD